MRPVTSTRSSLERAERRAMATPYPQDRTGSRVMRWPSTRHGYLCEQTLVSRVRAKETTMPGQQAYAGDQLHDRTVVDRDGTKVGKVADVFLDNDTGRPEWLLVHTG